MRYILIANGSWNAGPALDVVLRQHTTDPAEIIAVDGGANHAYRRRLTPSLIVGDLDSIMPDVLNFYQSQGIEIQAYPPEKDETDLELALLEAVQRNASWIRIFAALGDRLDQTFANIYLLSLPQLSGVDVKIVAGKQTIWLLQEGEHQLFGAVGDTISLLPFDGDVEGITTHHLAYPLQHETLYKGPARGISNVITGQNPVLSIERGKLLVIHTIGRA
ncbi:MAG: thiamine diphosphokinase [Phototrophicales bacterium]|nr:MAG: thiamine diphosphokinase [Phototrophicales bacterium]